MKYTYRTTTIDLLDTGDESILEGAWLAGECRGVRLGLYVTAQNGKWSGYTLDDHIAWNIDNDFRAAGINPKSKRAESIKKSWINAAKSLWPKIVKDYR